MVKVASRWMQRAITRREPCIVLRSPLVALNIDDHGRSPPRQTSPRSKQRFPERSARSFLSPAWEVFVAWRRLVRMVSQQMLPLRVSANLCSAVGTADTIRSRTGHSVRTSCWIASGSPSSFGAFDFNASIILIGSIAPGK